MRHVLQLAAVIRNPIGPNIFGENRGKSRVPFVSFCSRDDVSMILERLQNDSIALAWFVSA